MSKYAVDRSLTMASLTLFASIQTGIDIHKVSFYIY